MGFAAVNTGNNLLFLVVSGMLAFMSVTGYAGMRNIQGLEAFLSAPEEVYAAQPAVFTLQIRNRKRLFPSFLLECSLCGATATAPHLGRGASITIPVALTFDERGRISLTGVTVSSAFPVNFFVRSWRLPFVCDTLIFPRMIPSDLSTDDETGRYQSEGVRDQRGNDGEMERIVEYTGRESLRQIHWKLSARSDALKVKEFRAAAAEPIVIDLKQLPGDLEERVSRCAWMVRHWTADRPVGIKLGDQPTPPMQGRRQMLYLLAELATYGKEGVSGGEKESSAR